jgi:hypothetical protein
MKYKVEVAFGESAVVEADDFSPNDGDVTFWKNLAGFMSSARRRVAYFRTVTRVTPEEE